MKRRLAGLVVLLTVLSAPCARAAEFELPVAMPGEPLPADGPAASLPRPSRVHATFRVLPADSALYVGTPWFVRDLSVTLVGPGSQRRTLVANANLPGAMLGVRLPSDASRAQRVELDATTVSTVAPPYLLSADQLAGIAARDWWYAAVFGIFIVLALAFAAAGTALRSALAGWFAADAAVHALLVVPWLGIVRPSPDVSQPAHALLESCGALAAAIVLLRYAGRVPRTARIATWSLVALASAFAWGGDVLQDLWRVPDAVTQLVALGPDGAFVALAVAALVRRVPGAPLFVAATAIAAAGAGVTAVAPAMLASAPALPLLCTVASAVLAASALATRLRSDDLARTLAARAARIDGLTSLPNRTAVEEHVEAAVRAARRARSPLAAALVDVDHLAAYNACYGHLAGDDVLRRIAEVAAETAQRYGAFAGRYGGEEIALIVRACDVERARAVGAALHGAVTRLDIAHGGVPSRRLTVSVGVASIAPDARDGAHELLRRAADALYVAKAMGRNRVVADEPPERYPPKTESATSSFTAYAP